MRVHPAYGKSGLDIDLPETWDVTMIEPRFVEGLPDPMEVLQKALREPAGCLPLREFVRPSGRVGIIFSGITHPTSAGEG